MDHEEHPYADELDLMRHMLLGENEAWRSVITQYSGFLISMVRKIHSNYGIEISFQDAEDVVAEVWKNLVEKDMRVIKICMERKNLFPTLNVLTRNRSIDRIRKRKLKLVELNEETQAAYGKDPLKELFDKISSKMLLDAIEGLPYKQRVLVNLFFLQGKKYKEIAVLTGISQNSIGPTLSRAILSLRQAIFSQMDIETTE